MERHLRGRRAGRLPTVGEAARAEILAWVAEAPSGDRVTCEVLRALAFQRWRLRISRASAARILRRAGFRYDRRAGWRLE